MYDVKLAIYEQAKFCVEKDKPLFAPINGLCYKCCRNIYSPVEWSGGYITGITVEEARGGPITGCPHCHRSFCD